MSSGLRQGLAEEVQWRAVLLAVMPWRKQLSSPSISIISLHELQQLTLVYTCVQAQCSVVAHEMEDPLLRARAGLDRTSRSLADQNNAVVLAPSRDRDVNKARETRPEDWNGSGM